MISFTLLTNLLSANKVTRLGLLNQPRFDLITFYRVFKTIQLGEQQYSINSCIQKQKKVTKSFPLFLNNLDKSLSVMNGWKSSWILASIFHHYANVVRPNLVHNGTFTYTPSISWQYEIIWLFCYKILALFNEISLPNKYVQKKYKL